MGVIAFRVDASLQIGSGHVMRCMTLAERLREQGEQCVFISRQHTGHLLAHVREHGFPAFGLDAADVKLIEDENGPPHAAWLGCSWQDDAEQTRSLLEGIRPDWLIVDHYALDARWEGALRPLCRNLMVIDDLADRQHDCDLLVDQNLQSSGRYAGLLGEACTSLLGPKYALLRPQFAAARHNLSVRDGRVRQILIFFGGTDTDGQTLKALSAIELIGRPGLAVDVVIGEMNPHRAAVAEACRSQPRATLYCQVGDMAARMEVADLFVGAGGTSSWERCCLGLPAIVLAVAENQIVQSKALGHAGAQVYLGLAESVSTERLAQMIEAVMELPELLLHMAEQGRGLVDGRGVERVANYLMATTLTVRRVQPADSSAIYAWRNHPDTRRHASDPSEIGWEAHAHWFDSVLADPNRELLIAERDSRPIGVLRYDLDANHGLISIYLVPGLSGQSLGVHLLRAGEKWLRDVHPEISVCEAEIVAGNTASLAIFRAAGFQPYRSRFRKDLRDN